RTAPRATGFPYTPLFRSPPYLGAFSKAGHFGHMVINDDGQPGITGMPGSLEESIGNATVATRSGGKFKTTYELLKAYRSGDALARDVWITSVRKLAIGLASIVNILSPEVIVLGGGITEAGPDLFDPPAEFMNQYEWRTGSKQVTSGKAPRGDMPGAIGAGCYARETAARKDTKQ